MSINYKQSNRFILLLVKNMNAETYDSFGQSASGTSSLHPSDAIKMQDLISAIETSIQIESQMNIIKSINQKCFERCIYKPTSSALGN